MSGREPERLDAEASTDANEAFPAISARKPAPLLDGPGSTLITSATPVILIDDLMADGQPTSTDAPAAGGAVCPFCAHIRTDAAGSCPRCTMEDTPSTRRSTGERIGPWFVLQRKNPTAPGLRLSVLLTLARRGHVTPKSIVRGPTTGQFWRYAAQVKGLSRVFGLCWHCGASVSPDATTCPKCRSAQEIPDDPDQFLENHAALPVMREVVTQRELENPETDFDPRALPSARRELPEPRELAVRDSRATPGTRSVTLARGEEDVILSASELAAAFQLDLPKQGTTRRATSRLWRVTRVAALLLLLLGCGAATAFYLRPEWYDHAREVAKPYVDKGQSLVARVMGRTQRKPPALEDLSDLPPITPIQLEPTAGTAQINQDAAKRDPNKVIDTRESLPLGPAPKARSVWTGSSLVDANAPIDALGGSASIFQPTTRNTVVHSQPITELPELVDSIIARQDAARPNQPAQAVPPEAKLPAPSAVDTAAMSLDQAIATATQLRNSALDAEARKDWAAAVTIYEQIARLPDEAHPSDLKVKLAVARERARS